jgi:hypothetical protein
MDAAGYQAFNVIVHDHREQARSHRGSPMIRIVSDIHNGHFDPLLADLAL